MGHTGSVQRRGNPNGALYGEPLGSHPAGAVNRADYTPAQLQALYLSRGRPDMGFMSNQAMAPKDVPEMQQTCTVKNHVNLKKGSLKLVAASEPRSGKLSLEFQFDATKPCRATVLLLALESIDSETGCSSYSLQRQGDSRLRVAHDFPAGLAQTFSLEGVTPDAELFDLGRFRASELAYEDGSLAFPLIVVLEAIDAAKSPQSQATFCTFVRQPPGGSWAIKMLKQKVQVDGLTYELQEIYGIDGSLAAAPKLDAGSGAGSKNGASDSAKSGGGPRDELDIPDGAECIICLCEPRNTTVLPCRHMCLCSECAEALRKGSSTCPICRTRVEALLQIRVDTKDAKD
ncbi:hypothetical protein PybrP1_004312 [[Pythium] brassicae (nom. inval.)]|nr:hypothetical protein PybrP1_004312 [[Pythium] brassicae (nom. inval.)]